MLPYAPQLVVLQHAGDGPAQFCTVPQIQELSTESKVSVLQPDGGHGTWDVGPAEQSQNSHGGVGTGF